jgi:hypothetical protein
VRNEIEEQKLKEITKGALSSLDKYSFEKIQAINAIFHEFIDFPSFKSNQEFDTFISLDKERILKAKLAIEKDIDMDSIIDKELRLCIPYLCAEDPLWKYFDLSIEEQQFFIRLCAISSPEQREEMSRVTRQHLINRQTRDKITSLH